MYRVKAWRGTDMSPWSDWAAIVAPAVPSAPENLSALVGDGSVTLSWDDANDNSITGYQYRYRTGITWNPDWTAIGGSGANTTSHRLTGLTNGTEYTFEVRAINANGNGTLAGVTATPAPPPAAPGNLAGSAGDGTVTLSWDNPNDATITGYEYRYRTGAEWDPDWTEIGGSDFSTTSYTAEGLTSGALHTFQVRAVNAAGPGPSASASATPFPAAPVNLQATAGVIQVTLEWDDPADDGITVYQLKYGHGTTLVQDWSDISDTDQNTTEHTVEGLANGTAYTFKLRAKATDAPGDSSEVTATPFPAAPANLQAAAGVRQVVLTWNNPGDGGITVYQLKYGHGTTVVQDWSDVSGTNKNTTEHTVTSLTSGTAYTFKLRAKATDAPGDSSEVTATPYPAAPANLQAAAGGRQVALTWNNPGDDGITAYQLKYGHGTTLVQDWTDISGDRRKHHGTHGYESDQRDGVYVQAARESDGRPGRFVGRDGNAVPCGACQPEGRGGRQTGGADLE